jgi:hypothetical protein
VNGVRASRSRSGRSESAAIDALAREVCERRAVLFVGAGVSAHLGLPSWQDLMVQLGKDLGFTAEAFLNLSDDFRSLTEFYFLETGSLDSVISWMRREWEVTDDVLLGSRVHSLLVELGFQLIYTTNYDHLLEQAFALHGRRVNKVVSAKDIARIDAARPTIVKFHGDFDDPSSLVIAETDYFRRLSLEEPLDVKLRADAFGRPLLFVGYSFSDVNLRLLLYRLRSTWRETGDETLQPRSYIFMSRPNAVEERVLDSWGITPFVGGGDDDDAALVAFLERLCAACASR